MDTEWRIKNGHAFFMCLGMSLWVLDEILGYCILDKAIPDESENEKSFF